MKNTKKKKKKERERGRGGGERGIENEEQK